MKAVVEGVVGGWRGGDVFVYSVSVCGGDGFVYSVSVCGGVVVSVCSGDVFVYSVSVCGGVVVSVCGGVGVWWCLCVVVSVCGGVCVWWCRCVVVDMSYRMFTTASYHQSLLTTMATNVSRGWQTSSRTSASIQLPPSRGVLYGLDRSGRMACGRSGRIDQRQPQHAGGAPAGMRDWRGLRPVTGARPGSSVQGDSDRGLQSETIPQLGHVLPDVK